MKSLIKKLAIMPFMFAVVVSTAQAAPSDDPYAYYNSYSYQNYTPGYQGYSDNLYPQYFNPSYGSYGYQSSHYPLGNPQAFGPGGPTQPGADLLPATPTQPPSAPILSPSQPSNLRQAPGQTQQPQTTLPRQS